MTAGSGLSSARNSMFSQPEPHAISFMPTSAACHLVHLSDEGVDVLLPVTKVTTLDEMSELASTEAAVGIGQLEWPEEVGSLLEVGTNS